MDQKKTESKNESKDKLDEIGKCLDNLDNLLDGTVKNSYRAKHYVEQIRYALNA